MQVAGPIRYQLETDAQHVILHAYLPEGLSGKDVDISFDTDGSVDGGVAIHIENNIIAEELARIPVKNCKLMPDTQAKYTSSKRRLTLKLLSTDAIKPQSSIQSSNSFEFLDSDDVEDSTQQQEGSSAAKKKKNKKKKKKSGSGAGAEGQQDDEVTADLAADQTAGTELEKAASGSMSPEEADSAAAQDASSKKKKQKKKKGSSGETEQQAEAADEADEAYQSPASDEQPALPQEQQQVSRQGSQELHKQGSHDLHKHPSMKFDPATYMEHFEQQPIARTYLGAELPHRPQQGPVVKFSLAKNEYKGEDKWLQLASSKWEHPEGQAPVTFSAFGIFDGHGGKQAATFASKHLHAEVAVALDRCKGTSPDAQHVDGEEEEDWNVWATQEALLDRLPRAMHAGFVETDKQCKQKFAKSGTTATLAMQVGWELLVANVGDSCAYLDTGAEVLLVNGNHRLDDNAEERERIKKAGSEIAQSTADGVPVGPLRVWPGGLAMSRTIGDLEGGDAVTAEPEVRQISIPSTGARLILASDGLWDHMNAKTLVHQIRHLPAGAASNTAMYAALKKKGLRDDITVLVIDFVPTAEDKLPPALANGYPTHLVEHVNVLRPLQGGCSTTWRHHLQQRRAAAVAQTVQEEAAAVAAAAAEAEAAEAAAAQEEAAAQQQAHQGMSDTYKELAELRVDTDLLISMASQPAEAGAADDDEWVTVEKKHPAPSFMSELLANATVERLPAGYQAGQGGHGGRRDRDRQRRGDREGGREDVREGGRREGGREGGRRERGPRQQQEGEQGQQQEQRQQQGSDRPPRRERRPAGERPPRGDRPADAAGEAAGDAQHAGEGARFDDSRRRSGRGGGQARARREGQQAREAAAAAVSGVFAPQPGQQQDAARAVPAGDAAAPRVLEMPRASMGSGGPGRGGPGRGGPGRGGPRAPRGPPGESQPRADGSQRPPRRPHQGADGEQASGGRGPRAPGGPGPRGDGQRGGGDRPRRDGPRREGGEGRPRGPRPAPAAVPASST